MAKISDVFSVTCNSHAVDATLGADSDEEDTPEVNSSGAAGASGSSESSASTPEAKYVHKVIGGMVVKTENK